MADFLIESLRGGLNEDPPTSIADDQCTVARNVEFWLSMLGERRLGGHSLFGTPVPPTDEVVWLHRHLPTTNPADAQLWRIRISAGVASLWYRDTSWHQVAMPDAMVIDGKSEYQVTGQSFNGKLFIAYRSAVDRLHVWVNGATALRRVGLAPTGAAPSVAGTGSGTFAGVRYYRARFIEKSGTTIVRRSEYGPVATFTPPGNQEGAILSMPAAPGEGETNWEAEASIDGSNFYVIATVALGATVTDTVGYNHGYAQDYPLSEQSGDYELVPSVKLLTVEQNRLMGANLWMRPADASTVIWTPVMNAPGDGNDERLPVASVNVLGLDATEGGELTCLSATVNGYVYAMKQSHTYQLTRSGLRAHAYEAIPLTKQRGAISGSMTEGLDQAGNPTPYFLDADIGPCRIGPRGVEPCGADIRVTWDTVNLDAAKVVSRSLYFGEKKQVHWWIATGTSDIPNLRLVLHTQEMRQTMDGMRRGWAIWDGPSANAISCCMFADNVDAGVPRTNVLKPILGLIGHGTGIWLTDVGHTDDGTVYHAAIRTKPYIHGTLMNQFECHSGMLLASAVPGGRLDVTLRGDFGRVVKVVDNVTLDPIADEMRVIKNLDDLGLAELRALQVLFEDNATAAAAQWSLEQFAMRETSGARAGAR